MQETNTCIERCRKPVIAAIHGYSIGADFNMVTACDIRLASKDAEFSLREVGVTFVADVGVLQCIPLIMGQGIARELAFTPKYFNAESAKEILLVNKVYEDHNTLMAESEKMPNEIEEDLNEAAKAMMEKRKPIFTGKYYATFK